MKHTSATKRLSRAFYSLILLLALTSLGCRYATQLVIPATPTLIPTATDLPTATATAEPSATPLPSATASPTLDLVVSIATATLEASPTPHYQGTRTPMDFDLQMRVFEDAWQTVLDYYVDPDLNGMDWYAVYDQYKAKIDIQPRLSAEEFYFTMAEMVWELEDDHSTFLSPQMVSSNEEEFAGNYNYVGIGVVMVGVPERDRAVILVVFPGSPAEEAGLKPRDLIYSADGEAILDEEGYLKVILRGEPGSQVDVEVQTPGEALRTVTITRRAITSSLPIPHQVLITPEGKRIGYMLLTSFSDSTLVDSFEDALREMQRGRPLDGLIIDNRYNPGGDSRVAYPIMGMFTKGVTGYFVDREHAQPLNLGRGQDIDGSQKIPLVVLVGKGTVSFGEIFSGMMSDIERAYIIGETTDGNIELLYPYEFEDDSLMWLASETFRPLNQSEEDWEELGIIPDLEVIANYDEYSLETDPVVLAGLDYFDQK